MPPGKMLDKSIKPVELSSFLKSVFSPNPAGPPSPSSKLAIEKAKFLQYIYTTFASPISSLINNF
jgi:hypothetical protein